MGWVFLLVPLMAQPATVPQQASRPDQVRASVTQVVAGAPQLRQETRQRDSDSSAPPVGESRPILAPPVEPIIAAPSKAAAGRQETPATDRGESSGFPTMQFRGFSDVSYYWDDLEGPANSFALGQFNLFITSKLSDKLGVLAETVIEADQYNVVGIELERLLFRWASSDYLSVSVGRYHTAIGWYNTAYHHSSWMQTAIGRPFLFEFEDDGGILPIHNVGASISGQIPAGDLGLRYIVEVGNGRASDAESDEPVQNVVDENRGKAINLAILTRPAKLAGFEAGLSVYYDTLTPYGMPKVGETIVAGHAVYQTPEVEWLNEIVLVRNATKGSDHVADTTGFYTQVSRKFGAWRPYARYQYVSVPDDDPVFPEVGLQHGPSVGLRYDVGEFVALKFQYDRTERRGLSGYNAVATQLSFTF